MDKRLVLVLILSLFLFLLLISCGSGSADMPETEPQIGAETASPEEPSETETEPPTETETQTETESETETEEPTETETETEAVTEPPAPVYPDLLEDDGSPDLPVATVPDGVFLNPLTGETCSEELANRRPVGIMINNIHQSLPQQNIAAADIVYECQVEGGLTRLLAIYNDYADLVAIGSVRSSREYFIDFAANHDAIYVHAGGSDTAYWNLKARGINNLDAVNGGYASLYFYRDPYRRETLGMSLEHTLVIDGSALNEAIAYKQYRNTLSESFVNPFRFAGSGQTLVLKDGDPVSSFRVVFGSVWASFSYDPASLKYLRFQNGEPHVDGVTEEQLSFSNVLVLFCTYTYTYDDKNHIYVTDTGEGDGWYMTGGKAVPIKWRKESPDEPFALTLENGRPLYLNRGKTFVEVVSGSEKLTVQS